MRIISKHHDYYDSALGYGVDETLTYIRKNEFVPFSDIKADHELGKFQRMVKSASPHHRLSFDTIGFCGRLYIVVDFYQISASFNEGFLGQTASSNIKNIIRKLKKIQKDEQQKNKKPFSSRFHYHIRTHRSKSYFKNLNENHKSQLETIKKENNVIKKFNYDDVYECKNVDIFHELGCPVFVTGWEKQRDGTAISGIFRNPVLKSFDFQSVVDPFTAFQDISSFIGGVLSQTQYPPIEISDRLRKEMKGFNEWSFRKMPTKKKKI